MRGMFIAILIGGLIILAVAHTLPGRKCGAGEVMLRGPDGPVCVLGRPAG